MTFHHRCRLWAELAKFARKCQVWDVAFVSTKFCLAYDDKRWTGERHANFTLSLTQAWLTVMVDCHG